MIKVYTWVNGNPKNYEVHDFINRVEDELDDISKLLEFPEIGTTAIGWSYPTPPMELRSSFYNFIKKQLEHDTDYVVITFSTLVFNIIRLASKDLNLKDHIQVFDERMNLVTSIGESGRMYDTEPGLFDAEEQILLKLL